jgi:hypothetical protein
MPAHRRVNQHRKRDLLPSESVLRQARSVTLRWWDAAYLTGRDVLPVRFSDDAR